MKLWQKIFLWTLLIVMTAVSTLGVLLLKNNFRSSMKRQIQSTLSEHQYLISNINNRIVAERLRNDSILLTSKEVVTVIDGIFENSDTKEATVVALLNLYDEVLYNNTQIEINEELFNKVVDTKTTCKQIIREGSKHYLIIASTVTFERQDYIFVTSTNISEIYNLYTSQLNYAKLLSVCLSLSCAFFLLVLVKLLLLPLAHLNSTTHSIAGGDYSKRFVVTRHDELGELAENMNVMANSVEENISLLQETADNRRQFIDNLSHEMKTPLTSILGFADIMRIKRNITPEELSEYSGIIFEEAKRLKNLSGKLMEIITVGETNLEFNEITMSSLFSQVELALKPIFENNHINLISSYDECTICIDLELFKSMLFNLVDNAIKASKKESNIFLEGHYYNELLTISIKDEGIGIDADKLNKITEPFYMVDKARSRKAGGAGLGLALCKRIAEIHNSKFLIESQKGVGTTVTLVMKGVNSNE